jgi:hypothetical protein
MSSREPPDDNDLQTVVDGHLSVEVPAYMRKLKRGLCFSGPTTHRDNRCLISLDVFAVDSDAATALLKNLKHLPKSMPTSPGVTTMILKRGPVDWLEDGYILLAVRTCEGGDHPVPYDYNVVYGGSNHRIEARILGYGEQQHFEDVCHKIILSIHEQP